MNALAALLAALALEHEIPAGATEKLWQLVLMAEDWGRYQCQCPGCGGKGCLRVRGGEPCAS